MEQKLKQRICIEFCVKLQISATDTFEIFKAGRISIEDDPRQGRPTFQRTDENVQKITDLIKENPRTTLLELEQDTGISKTTIGRIVTEDLRLKKTPAKFIPRFLTNEQKLCRLATCEDMLEMTRTDPEWKDKIITGDETWVYGYDPETKRQSAEWRGQDEPRPKKSRILKSRNKVLLVAFLDNKGIVHHEYLPAGQTVIKEMYLSILRRLREAIRKKRLEKWTNGDWILHHDNARPHTAHLVTSFLAKNGTEILPQPPYSPDIAPNDFFLFPKLKAVLKGRHFDTRDDIIEKSLLALKSIPKEAYKNCFDNWEKRWRCDFMHNRSSDVLDQALEMATTIRRLLYAIGLWTCFGYLFFRVAYPELALSPTVPRGEDPAWERMPLVDAGPHMTDRELLASLSNRSNLPRAYWGRPHQSSAPEDSCVAYPSLYDLQFNNFYWQVLDDGANGSFYLFGAYFDNRTRPRQVRLVGMIDRIKPPPSYCLLWFSEMDAPVTSQSTYIYSWYKKWGNYKDHILQPFIISCPLPARFADLVPSSVSLVAKKCDQPTNNLRVIHNVPPVKKDFAVCVKGLDFLHDDLSVRLVEWLELLRLLGADKVFLYELEVHPNISKVLQYYQKDSFVELTPISLPGHQPNIPGFRHLYLKSRMVSKRQNEIIPYNDCLYRNLNAYRYVVLLDIDEVIMPVRHNSWHELIQEVHRQAGNTSRSSYNVRNVYFLDDLQDGEEMRHQAHEQGIPYYLHMLQHVYRSKNFTTPGSFVKCFHNTDSVVSLHNHFPLDCLGACTTFPIDTTLAQLQHYRKDCPRSIKDICKNDYRKFTVRDTTIWRYKSELVHRTTQVLQNLGFFS
ncbi:hypothetical protein LAZ67_3001139 [Cordylochernes scorpioides]|uniref:Glycosyltransferase family 92 protein n=1 Tax=Cordylochernes scorpioides TaxID=51811 RepID=A0ABY6K7I2_9ARAC|nr:hypothetical protein LAZ67_3001139 [Cordylochernes scorpioides]